MPLEHEYKLMGMAPYASPSAAEEVAAIFARYLDRDPANLLRMKRKTPEAMYMLGPRLEKDLRRRRFDEICAGLQLFTESLMVRWVEASIEATGVRNVVAAGGVFMNVKANKRILELPSVESFEVFPSCGDETLCFGAGYLALSESGTRPDPLTHFYLGMSPHSGEAEALLSGRSDLLVRKPADLAGEIAELLAAGKIVARCAGPMEFGARALGNRSILADPQDPDVVRIINRMIKKRDFWMPFAPVVRLHDADKFFVNPKNARSPYMMMTFDTTDRREEMMAAVHGADLTARAQVLEPGQNPAYEAIIVAFQKRTGRSVLLNTSFNLHGYPIVQGAREAMHVFDESDLRHLVVDDLLISKQI